MTKDGAKMAAEKVAAIEDGADFEAIMAEKKPATETVPLCMDYGLVIARDKAARLSISADREERRDADDEDKRAVAAALRLDLADAEELVVAASRDFSFESIGRQAYEELQRVHAPSKKQVDDFKEELGKLGLPKTSTLQYNPDKFPPALISSCSLSPKMTFQQAERLWNSTSFTRAELAKLFQAAVDVNNLIAS